jgi:hypothetical protein
MLFRMEMTLVKSLHGGGPDVIQNTRTCKASAWQQAICLARCQLGIKSALQALFGLHHSAVHFRVCSCNTCTGGSHVVGSYVDVSNGSFLASAHRGGPGSIPGRPGHVSPGTSSLGWR